MINIGGDKNDASYRYKMPKLVAKVEGRGNGIKTAVINMVEVAKALKIHPAYPTKFFGMELGAQSKFDKKRDHAIVNGAHTYNDLAEVLDKFVEQFILCPTCRLPEIAFTIVKDSIHYDCAACGATGIVPPQHRLVTYILKNPKGIRSSKSGKKGKSGPVGETKAARRLRKLKQREQASGGDAPSEEVVSVVPGGDRAKLVQGPTSPSSSSLGPAPAPKEEEIVWFTDSSKEAAQARKEEEMRSIGGGSGEKGADRMLKIDAIARGLPSKNVQRDSPVDILREFLQHSKRSMEAVCAEVRRLQLARGYDATKRMKILFEAMFNLNEPKTVVSTFKQYAEVLAQYSTDEHHITIFIGCIEELVGVLQPKLMTRVPMIFQVLYEDDVLDEDDIMRWYGSPPESSWIVGKDVAARVRQAAQPFIKWLQDAEEEEGSSSEEEEVLVRPSKILQQPGTDVDIDDI